MSTKLRRITVNLEDGLYQKLKRDTSGGTLKIASVATAILWEHYHVQEALARLHPQSPAQEVSEWAGAFGLGEAILNSPVDRHEPGPALRRRASGDQGKR